MKSVSPRKRLVFIASAATLLISTAFTAGAQAAPLPNCSDLAPQLLKDSDIAAATAAIQPAANGNLPYCSINITVSHLAGPRNGYLAGQKQQIGIAIGLPLNTVDGGSGGMQGNWNGRIQDLGGGGCFGVVSPPTFATNAGYAGSTTDTGHKSSGCAFALNPDGTLNWGLIRDFGFNGIHQQTVWTKKLVHRYYGMNQKYAYWNGCSGGGYQGHVQSQRYPDEYDGIIAGDPTINWERTKPAQMWPSVVQNIYAGGFIAPAKTNAATQAAIAACDGLDGIRDGVLQDPRACHFSAQTLVCTGAPTDPATCLTPGEATAIDKIWNGIIDHRNRRIFFGLERGTPLSPSLANFTGTPAGAPYTLGVDYFKDWIFRDPSFDWHTFTEDSLIDAMKLGEIKFHDVVAGDDPDLSAFQAHGGKMLGYFGLNSQLTLIRGTLNYYNRVTDRMGGLANVQSFYREFPYPGNNHCLGNVNQPNAPLISTTTSGGNAGAYATGDLFQSLVNWVEHGVAPDRIVAYNNLNPALATVSRPICKYPDKLVYIGSGSTNVASNFVCQREKHDPLIGEDLVVPDLGAKSDDDDRRDDE